MERFPVGNAQVSDRKTVVIKFRDKVVIVGGVYKEKAGTLRFLVNIKNELFEKGCHAYNQFIITVGEVNIQKGESDKNQKQRMNYREEYFKRGYFYGYIFFITHILKNQ